MEALPFTVIILMVVTFSIRTQSLEGTRQVILKTIVARTSSEDSLISQRSNSRTAHGYAAAI